MISNFIKLTLVTLILCVGITPLAASNSSFDSGDNLPDLTPEQIAAYIELNQEYIHQTKPDFENTFNLQLSELRAGYDSYAHRAYLYTLKKISQESLLDAESRDPHFLDPALKDGFNTAYNGSVNSTFKFEQGEIALAWIDHKPIVITSKPKTFERTMYVPEGVDLGKKDVRRLIYHLHVFDGNNGFGIADLVETSSRKSLVKRVMSSFKRFRKKNFVRGVDLNIVRVNNNAMIIKSQVSKKPRYLSAQYFKEYWGAMNHGRNVNKAKAVKAAIFGGISASLSYTFLNAEMAIVMAGLTISSQLYYEGYLTFKYTNSRIMQVIKQTALIAFTGSMYTVMHYGLNAEMQAWETMVTNTLKSSGIFFTAGYAKQLLLESGLTKKSVTLIPSFGDRANNTVKNSIPGREVKFLGRKYFIPNKVKFSGVTLDAAKTHDFILDTLISLGRQLDLVLSIPYVIPAIFAGLHTYSAAIYSYVKRKDLTNPATEMISKEVFYRGYIKKAMQGLKKVGLRCNSLLLGEK